MARFLKGNHWCYCGVVCALLHTSCMTWLCEGACVNPNESVYGNAVAVYMLRLSAVQDGSTQLKIPVENTVALLFALQKMYPPRCILILLLTSQNQSTASLWSWGGCNSKSLILEILQLVNWKSSLAWGWHKRKNVSSSKSKAYLLYKDHYRTVQTQLFKHIFTLSVSKVK